MEATIVILLYYLNVLWLMLKHDKELKSLLPFDWIPFFIWVKPILLILQGFLKALIEEVTYPNTFESLFCKHKWIHKVSEIKDISANHHEDKIYTTTTFERTNVCQKCRKEKVEIVTTTDVS